MCRHVLDMAADFGVRVRRTGVDFRGLRSLRDLGHVALYFLQLLFSRLADGPITPLPRAALLDHLVHHGHLVAALSLLPKHHDETWHLDLSHPPLKQVMGKSLILRGMPLWAPKAAQVSRAPEECHHHWGLPQRGAPWGQGAGSRSQCGLRAGCSEGEEGRGHWW